MANPFQNIMTSLSSLLKKSDESVLGIDIGSSSIKVVQLKKKRGKATLETYGELSLGPYAEVEVGRSTNLPVDKIAAALTDLLREANTTTKKCGVAIPIGSSLLTVMEMPAVNEKDLVHMVPIEARKYIPVPISEVSLDWSLIPKDSSIKSDEETEEKTTKDKIEVLVIAIHNEMVNRYRDIIKAAALDSSFIEIEIFSTIRALLDHSLSTVMLFDMGASSTKLYIVERGVVRSSHTVNRGSQDITLALASSLGVSVAEAENLKRNYGTTPGLNDEKVFQVISLTMDYVFAETNQIILDYERKHNKNVSRVILTGGGFGYTGLLELAKKTIQGEVEVGDPFAKVEYPAFLESVLKLTGPGFAVAVGVALRRLQEVN